MSLIFLHSDRTGPGAAFSSAARGRFTWWMVPFALDAQLKTVRPEPRCQSESRAVSRRTELCTPNRVIRDRGRSCRRLSAGPIRKPRPAACHHCGALPRGDAPDLLRHQGGMMKPWLSF